MSWTRCVFIVATGLGLWTGGCASTKAPVDPLIELADRTELANPRLRALTEVKAEASGDSGRKASIQRVYHDIAWTNGEPVLLRLAVLDAMMKDSDPKISADAHETVKLLLPRERSLEVVRFVCRKAAELGWTDCVPSLIRSYSRSTLSVKWPDMKNETDRPERAAIEQLSGGKPVERVVFEVFLKPPELAATYGMDWAQRFRADAWDLLARLDTGGTMRVSMLSELPEEGTDELVSNIRRCVKELRAMPLTGDELKWMMSLVDPKKPANAQWWKQTSAAIAGIGEEGRKGVLSLRHAEAIRWAAATHPKWLAASRQELLSELRSRIDARTIHERTAESGKYRVRETLVWWQDRLRWADLVSILAIDEAIRSPEVVKALVTQAELDRKDKTTEYGGVLLLRSALPSVSGQLSKAGGDWVAMLYPPRPGQRQGDEVFVASDDMIAASDQALAHYHLHAQTVRNSEFAGPSPGDLVYAARSGRACVVVTTLDDGKLDVDYYQPDGVVIDLGEVTAASR